MKLNGKTKFLISTLATLLVVDLWRDWPWVKKFAKAFTGDEDNHDTAQ